MQASDQWSDGPWPVIGGQQLLIRVHLTFDLRPPSGQSEALWPLLRGLSSGLEGLSALVRELEGLQDFLVVQDAKRWTCTLADMHIGWCSKWSLSTTLGETRLL